MGTTMAHVSDIMTQRPITLPAGVRLEEICSSDVMSLAPHDKVEDAVTIMRHKAIRRLPVVDNGTPVGMVSIGDLAIHRDEGSALGDISAAPPNR